MLDRLEASKTLSTVDDAALYRYCQLHGARNDSSSNSPNSSGRLRGSFGNRV